MKETDKKTRELFAIVQKKKSEIKAAEKPQWKTNCAFYFTESPKDPLNIQISNDTGALVRALAFLYEKDASYKAAAKDLGVDIPFSWHGYSVDTWKVDIQARINKIQIEKKKKELEALEKRLDAILSPELKAEMELEAIMKELES
jgi:hypothetical protein